MLLIVLAFDVDNRTSPLEEENIPMAVGINLLALVGVERDKAARIVKEIGQLLCLPPFVSGLAFPHFGVIRCPEKIEAARFDRIAKVFDDATIVRRPAV